VKALSNLTYSAIRFYHELNLGFDSLNEDPFVYLRPDALMTYIKLNAEHDSHFTNGFRQEQINMNILNHSTNCYYENHSNSIWINEYFTDYMMGLFLYVVNNALHLVSQ
jgi:hypothetical protein